jgi:hypothetical protein
VDLLGLLAPQSEVEGLCAELESGAIADLDTLQQRFDRLHAQYREFEWAWAQAAVRERGTPAPADLDPAGQARLLADWAAGVAEANHHVLADARKEYDDAVRVGFGLDGEEETRDADFAAVRGRFDDSACVRELRADTESAAARAAELRRRLEG